jgi:hypothetical protein
MRTRLILIPVIVILLCLGAYILLVWVPSVRNGTTGESFINDYELFSSKPPGELQYRVNDYAALVRQFRFPRPFNDMPAFDNVKMSQSLRLVKIDVGLVTLVKELVKTGEFDYYSDILAKTYIKYFKGYLNPPCEITFEFMGGNVGKELIYSHRYLVE